MHELRVEDSHSRRWLLVPEAAPLLFQVGLDGRDKNFQRAVVRLQIALEETCAQAAHPGQILLCHRGTLDPLAYWLRNGWEEQEFFTLTGMNREEHFRRYTGVLHLQTTAIDAQEHYRRWPDAHRPETLEQAAKIDYLCAYAWRKHPRYVLIENREHTWIKKRQMVYGVLTDWQVS